MKRDFRIFFIAQLVYFFVLKILINYFFGKPLIEEPIALTIGINILTALLASLVFALVMKKIRKK